MSETSEIKPTSTIVNYPKLEMPEPPKTTLPKIDQVPSCEGLIEPRLDPALSQVAPPPEGKMRIMIGVPLLDVKYEFFESFLRFWSQLMLAQDIRYEIGYHFAYRRPVHMAEEYLVDIARYNKCTHILFMDDDIYDITKADLDKLVEAKKEIISGVMYASKFPHAMCVFRRFDTSKKVMDMPVDDTMYRLYEVPCLCPKCNAAQSHWDGKWCIQCGAPQDNLVQPCDLIPFPFTLMDLKIFDKIKQPWFHCTTKYPSDSWFADRVIEAGLQEYAHMGVRLNHAGITDATKPFYAQMGMAKAQGAGGVVNITPKEMEQHQTLLLDKMKEAESKLKPKVPFSGETGAAELLAKKELTLMTHGT